MSSPSLTPDPPKWFDLDNYKYAKDLDAVGWRRELIIRRDDAELINNLKQKHENYIQPDSAWFAYQQNLINKDIYPDDSGPIVQEVESSEWEIGFLHLSIDLSAPIDIIISKIRSILASKSWEPFKKPGRPPKPNIPSEPPIDTWTNYRILPLFDLLHWHEIYGKQSPSHNNLGIWLYPDIRDRDTYERARYAQHILEKALVICDAITSGKE